MPSSHRKLASGIYENPRLYDLAFSYRDFAKECDGILAIASRHGVPKPRKILELACGPAHHLREFARRGLMSVGVDLSPEMLGYAQTLCKRDGVTIRFQKSDIRSYHMRTTFDIALCLFDSFTHCTSDDDGIAALRATASRLQTRGLLILELTHPADFFSKNNERTVGRWIERYPDVVVRARFDHDHRDAIAETYTATMTIDAKYRGGRAPRRIVSRQSHRMWLRSGIASIVAQSGAFDVVGWYGDLNPRVPLTMKLDAWRMVAVLRKK